MRHEWVLSLFCKLIGMPWEHCLQLNFNHIYHLSEQPLPSECPWVVFRYNDLCTESTCYVYHWYTSPAASHHLTRTHTDKDKVMNDNTLMHSRQSAQTPHKRSNCTVALLETASQGMSAAVGTDPSCIAQVFLFAIVDSLPRRCNALLNRLLSARMILSTQMENSLPTVAISNYCMRGYYMIYEVSMHARFLKSQLRRKDAAVTA